VNKKGRVVAVVQARMGSTRLPGKVMKSICDKPVIELMLERLLKSQLIDEIVVATTTLNEDDVIFDWAKKSNYSVFRGSELDCLDRHYQVGKKFNAQFIAKITPDCPFIDPQIVDKVIGYFLENSEKFDYVSNAHPPSYPDGLDMEIMHLSTLETAWKHSVDPIEREHTTTYIWQNPDIFRIGNVLMPGGKNLFMTERWTLDYPEDFEFTKTVYENLYKNEQIFLMDEILQFLSKRSDVKKINSHLCEHNSVH
jgi:spore coat polysaccharide biosynthesis protein SpsF